MKITLNRQNRAVMYLRIDSPFLQDLHRVDMQRRGCRQIAAKYGLQIIREYTDVGTPAILGRQTALLHLLEDVARQRDAAYVVVWDYSRLGHSMQQLDEVTRLVTDCGATIVTLTGVEAAGRFMYDQAHKGEEEVTQ
jgi:DNA invertase Pin-like site-specific DNA recombinase